MWFLLTFLQSIDCLQKLKKKTNTKWHENRNIHLPCPLKLQQQNQITHRSEQKSIEKRFQLTNMQHRSIMSYSLFSRIHTYVDTNIPYTPTSWLKVPLSQHRIVEPSQNQKRLKSIVGFVFVATQYDARHISLSHHGPINEASYDDGQLPIQRPPNTYRPPLPHPLTCSAWWCERFFSLPPHPETPFDRHHKK